jgi:hypothetical protein
LPYPIGPRGKENWNSQFKPPSPLSLGYIIPNLKRIGAVVIKKLEVFKC